MEAMADPEPVLSGKNISFLELTVERATEIQKLTDAIENPNRTKMVYQRLPRHMQRRAMSHDPKRLPVRARQIFEEQRDVTQLKASKRPSRRHRRRPSRLLEEYNRRQREHVWLETHIWHARRFHMVKRWGYTLPESATDKGFRAAYRATARHCLVQDVSYLCHLELSGAESAILSALASLGGAGAGSARLLSGRHHGRVLLCSADAPRRPLAPAGVLWKPPEAGSGAGADRQRRLWLWVHPAGYEAVLAELLLVLGLDQTPVEEPVEAAEVEEQDIYADLEDEADECGDLDDDMDTGRSKPDAAEAEAMECEVAPTEKTGTAKEATGNEAAATERGTAAATAGDKTTGTKPKPKPKRVPKNVDQLKLAPRRLEVVRRYVSICSVVTLTVLRDRLVRLRLCGPGSQAALAACLRLPQAPPAWDASTERLEARRELWRRLEDAESPAELPPGCVIGLTVDDPRRHLPQRRTMATHRPQELSTEPITDLPAGCETSPLWDESIRRLVTTSKVSDNLLNRARSRLAVPAATPAALRLEPLPVLLLQNDRSPGWDLLVPAGWGMTFWVALQYNGARAGGLRETDRMALETGTLRFPAEYPDSAAGLLWDEEDRARQRTEYFKRPPDKRPNFAKLSVPDPFSSPWRRLRSSLCPGEPSSAGPVPVCRDRCTLSLLSAALSGGGGRPAALSPGAASCLAAVRVTACARGVPRPGALLCLPRVEDAPPGHSRVGAGVAEPAAEDPAAAARAQHRAAWLKKQRTEKRRRRRCRGREQQEKAREAAERLAGQRAEQHAEMERLSLPAESTQPTRQVIGHVTSGDFCLSEAVGLATGFVLVEGLLRLLDLGGSRLLFRNADSDTYRWCSLQLITEPC